jgi:translation initiation factor 2 gamma subunit (eIF-2gamma)
MITGASQADAAVLVCSAKEGIQAQTKEHAFLAKVLGIKQMIVAVNKMDAVNYDHVKFDETKTHRIQGRGHPVCPILWLCRDQYQEQGNRRDAMVLRPDPA